MRREREVREIKRFFRRLCFWLTPLCAAVLVAVGAYGAAVPSAYVVAGNSKLVLPAPLTAVEAVSQTEEHAAQIRLLGVFPVKDVAVRQANDMQVVLGGEVFGMKLYTDGVLVVGLTDVDTKNGNRNPAAEAGICKGDQIRSVNGTAVTTMNEVALAVEQSDGTLLDMEIVRDIPCVTPTRGRYCRSRQEKRWRRVCTVWTAVCAGMRAHCAAVLRDAPSVPCGKTVKTAFTARRRIGEPRLNSSKSHHGKRS